MACCLHDTKPLPELMMTIKNLNMKQNYKDFQESSFEYVICKTSATSFNVLKSAVISAKHEQAIRVIHGGLNKMASISIKNFHYNY